MNDERTGASGTRRGRQKFHCHPSTRPTRPTPPLPPLPPLSPLPPLPPRSDGPRAKLAVSGSDRDDGETGWRPAANPAQFVAPFSLCCRESPSDDHSSTHANSPYAPFPTARPLSICPQMRISTSASMGNGQAFSAPIPQWGHCASL